MTTTNNPMTHKAIVRVIAERDGWKLVRTEGGEYHQLFNPQGEFVSSQWKKGTTLMSFDYRLPDYLSSRDALFPVIGKLSEKERIKFMELVWLSRPDKEWDLPDHDFLIEILTLPPETLAPLVARAIVESK